jgi:hypothetical protein
MECDHAPVPIQTARLRRTACLAFFSFLLLFGGCSSPPFRASRNLDERTQNAKSILLLPPKVNVYELSAGGIREKMDEWSDKATTNVVQALKLEIGDTSGSGLRILPIDSLVPEARVTYDETQALFEAVNASVLLHTYGESEERFSDKIENFAFSLGTEVGTLVPGADLFLFVRGVDYKSTTGRQILKIGAAVVGALFGIAPEIQGDPTQVSMALVDAHDGTVLWYNLNFSGSGTDLREYPDAEEMVKNVFKHFPKRLLPPAAGTD